MTIAEQIYHGKSAEELGIDEIAYASRKEVLDRFMAGRTEFDEEEFLAWLPSDESGNPGEEKPALPTITERANNLVRSAADVTKLLVSQGIVFADERVQEERLKLCQSCEFILPQSRCSKCGCYMKFKTTLAAMKCPVGKW